MHTSFTGNARRTRQINLSGRNVTNPWAALPGGNKSSLPSNTQNTVANAQADRARRQQDRDRQNAVKKIQRTWRGYSARAVQKQKWRLQWDQTEQQRLQSSTPLEYETFAFGTFSAQKYTDKQLCLAQMQLLSRLVNVRDRSDVLRLSFFGDALCATMAGTKRNELGRQWHLELSRLLRITGRTFDLSLELAFAGEEQSRLFSRLLDLSKFLISLVPEVFQEDARTQFHALMNLVKTSGNDEAIRSRASDFALSALSTTINTSQAYQAFALEMFSDPDIIMLKPLLDKLHEPTFRDPLCTGIVDVIASDTKQSIDIERYLWILTFLLFISKRISDDQDSFSLWINTVSALLSRCANEISVRIDDLDQPMEGTDSWSNDTMHQFMRVEITRLTQQQSVESIIQQLKQSEKRTSGSVSMLAKPLANYAVALLRAFPSKALNIRMWLYRSSPSNDSTSTSTILYLWQAARSTSVFQKILKDHRSVLSVLTEAAPEQNQMGRAPIAAHEIALWQEEWRILLLFMELYTFILKIMDDEEFFALDESRGFAEKSSSSQFSQGALPLADIARLTTFLKNLAFPLYWNAADLAETNEIEEVGGISALFGTTSVEPNKHNEKKTPRTLAGNGLSQAYLKDRVTGLLRMLHERDSRRRFLPENHWLMTNQVDMQGFIPAVVAEEERRHESGDADDDGETEDIFDDTMDSEDTFALQSFNTMFGIRPPHTPRTQTSRFNDQMTKRRAREKRRRQAESLVPRLEILRNLPFFIPFDTRVQIFREFVYRDQFVRRHGWVDPDQWRFSMANGQQGRASDGHSRGVDIISRHHAEIRRGMVFDDAYDKFYELGDGLKEPIQISFIDRFGTPEAGIDGGGVTKEFLMSVTGEAFDPNNDKSMFVENEQHFLFPNPKILELSQEILLRQGIQGDEAAFNVRELLRRYEFLGRVVGKCMYEGILVDLNFAGFFLLKWALTGGTTSATTETAYRASINDLKDFDEGLYQGLLKLKNYKGDVESDFGLDFTASDEVEIDDGPRHTWTKDLVLNGSNTPVTNGNRLLYIDKITRYRLQQQPLQVTNAFLKGLGQLIQPMWLAMFNQRELQKLVGGDNAELDLNDLRRNTQYGGVYVIGDDGLEHPTVALFWKVLKAMTDADRRKVLKFVTSTPRAPLLGFSHLNPKFSIRDSSEDQTRLPSTSTCINLLKLPRYGDETTMRDKLLYAINSGAGFDLS